MDLYEEDGATEAEELRIKEFKPALWWTAKRVLWAQFR